MTDDKLLRRMEKETGKQEEKVRGRERAREKEKAAIARSSRSDPRGFAALIEMSSGWRLGTVLFLWALTWVVSGSVIIVAFRQEALLIGLAIGIPIAVPIPALLVVSLARWRFYRHWRERPGFELEDNLDELAADRSGEKVWRAAEIAVELGSRKPEHGEAVTTALRLFCARANAKVYETTPGQVETIQRWSILGYTCEGDANVLVAWDLVRLIGSDLPALVQTGVPIDRVVLSVSSDARNIPARVDPDPAKLST